MQIEPQAPVFAKRYARGEAQVLWTTLVSDLETPVSAFAKLRPLGGAFLLESVEGGERMGRYSFIGVLPRATLVFEPVVGGDRHPRGLTQGLGAADPSDDREFCDVLMALSIVGAAPRCDGVP